MTACVNGLCASIGIGVIGADERVQLAHHQHAWAGPAGVQICYETGYVAGARERVACALKAFGQVRVSEPFVKAGLRMLPDVFQCGEYLGGMTVYGLHEQGCVHLDQLPFARGAGAGRVFVDSIIQRAGVHWQARRFGLKPGRQMLTAACAKRRGAAALRDKIAIGTARAQASGTIPVAAGRAALHERVMCLTLSGIRSTCAAGLPQILYRFDIAAIGE